MSPFTTKLTTYSGKQDDREIKTGAVSTQTATEMMSLNRPVTSQVFNRRALATSTNRTIGRGSSTMQSHLPLKEMKGKINSRRFDSVDLGIPNSQHEELMMIENSSMAAAS